MAEVDREAPGPGSATVALAKTAFLNGGVLRAVDTDVVREPILASWTRSRRWQVPTDDVEVPFLAERDADTPLLRAARPVLAEAADQFATEPVSVVVCDADGVVLTRETGDPLLQRHLDRVQLAPGFSYAERHVGTNGIGTALEGGGPARVFGHEHYVEHLEELACAAVPIRHTPTARVLGVMNLTCWRRDAGATMLAATAALSRRIETALLAQSGRRQHALLHDYLAACRRHRDAVIGVGSDLLMLNDRARALLDPADQAPVLAEATEALATGRPRQLLVDLPGGLTARLECRPTVTDDGVVGGVVTVALVMNFLSLERVHERLGWHWLRMISLALRYGGKIFGTMLDSLVSHAVDKGHGEVVVLDGDNWPRCAGWC